MIAFRRRQKMFDRLRNRETAARDDTLLYILGGIAVMFFVCNIPAAINLLFINEVVKKRPDYQVRKKIFLILKIFPLHRFSAPPQIYLKLQTTQLNFIFFVFVLVIIE